MLKIKIYKKIARKKLLDGNVDGQKLGWKVGNIDGIVVGW
jgi:hypothetical protein